MTDLSLTHLLAAIELGFLFFLAGHWKQGRDAAAARPVFLYLLWLTFYALVTTVLGAQGFYTSEGLLALLPGLWLQLVTVGAAVVPVLLFPSLRHGLRQIAAATPWHWFAYFQALRISALGTAYKTWIGAFPVHFEILVGIPDLLFGLSALWIASKAKRGEIGVRGFLAWNLVGAAIIVPAAPVLLQLGLPGPLQVFTALPDTRAVYAYPMSIAPMFGVPLFVLVNLWVAWALWAQKSRVQATAPQI